MHLILNNFPLIVQFNLGPSLAVGVPLAPPTPHPNLPEPGSWCAARWSRFQGTPREVGWCFMPRAPLHSSVSKAPAAPRVLLGLVCDPRTSPVVRTVAVAQWWTPRHSGFQCGWNVKRLCFPPLFWAAFMGVNLPLLQLGIKAGWD